MYGPLFSAPTESRKSNPGLMGFLAVRTVRKVRIVTFQVYPKRSTTI